MLSKKKDKEVVLKAVKKNGFSLKYASEELKKDKEVVLEAVKQNGHSLQYASEELKKDKEIEWISKKNFKCIREIPTNNFLFHFHYSSETRKQINFDENPSKKMK